MKGDQIVVMDWPCPSDRRSLRPTILEAESSAVASGRTGAAIRFTTKIIEASSSSLFEL